MKPELQGQPQLIQRHEGRCVLIVDDEPLIRDICKRTLDDYRVLQAANGSEALEILRKQPVDVVLSDIMMPDMDGLTLLQKAKELDPTQVVVMMTGFADKELVLRALRENADDFLTKPLNLVQLRTTLSKALDKKRLKEELVYLRRMDRLKNDFLGLVSHKLKTPVTALSLFLQNLANGIDDPNDPDYQEHLKMALDESHYLQSLISDLLQHSEAMLAPDTNPTEEVETNDLLQTLAIQFNDRTTEKNLTLLCELDSTLPTIVVDRNGLYYTLTALLDNAFKFSARGGTVTFSAVMDGETLRVCVHDQGPGIAREEIPKVFEKFYQVDPEGTGQVRGFGLGLYFARHFAQFHRGTLTLESAPHAGTFVCLNLPVKA
ncbi:MAG: hybrid sensor histidine kinase/response regulator [Desulfuromonas sp.]|nr:MAG: hybrid sensor histidine kinase/response regulator [Desulfuromonas sp.]